MNARAKGNWQGMNWITQVKRLAIYLRDGAACVWCGATVEGGVQLTLDHVVCHSKKANNHESNLVTCCKHCNDSRGTRSANKFSVAVATYINHGISAEAVLNNVRKAQRRSLKQHLIEAKALIAIRGSAFAALKGR